MTYLTFRIVSYGNSGSLTLGNDTIPSPPVAIDSLIKEMIVGRKVGVMHLFCFLSW